MARVKKVEEIKKVLETKETLQEKLTEAGKLKDKIDRETAKLKELLKELEENLEVGEKIVSDKYQAIKVKTVKTGIDTKKAGEKLTKKDLLQVATISKTKLKKIMSEKEISELETEPTISTFIKIGRVK